METNSKTTPESFIGIKVQCASDIHRKGEIIEADLVAKRVRVKWEQGPRTWMRMSNLKIC